jgi:hypothetical protein
MPGAEQRNDGRKPRVIQRLRHSQPHELRRVGSTQRRGRSLRIQGRTQPPRRQQTRGGPQLLGQAVLLDRIGGRRSQ